MDDRIERFRRMTEADPANELGHYSLGKALLEAGRAAEALGPLRRAVELNPQNARACHQLALALRAVGDFAAAVEVLQAGLQAAHARGDRMPMNDMAALMRELGVEPPAISAGAALPARGPAGDSAVPATAAAGSDVLICRRCGRTSPRMERRPFKGPLGEKVWSSVCQTCWREWIPMGTKVINELRLDFAVPEHAAIYDQHMKEFLNLD